MTSAALNPDRMPIGLFGLKTERRWSSRVNRVIRKAGIAGGPHARPKGIRYGFLVEAIRCGIILTRTENWMGYSHTSDIGHYVEQLAQYAPELVGDERGDASLMW